MHVEIVPKSYQVTSMKKEVMIYTDGACSGNPGPGGYAAILIYNGVEKIIKGNESNTTNNRMEVIAIIEGLKALKEKCNVTVYSDSAYAVNAINKGWIANWMRNGWKTANKQDVLNVDLWKELNDLVNNHKVEFIKVKGHSDNEYNNKCDLIARDESIIAKKSL